MDLPTLSIWLSIAQIPMIGAWYIPRFAAVRRLGWEAVLPSLLILSVIVSVVVQYKIMSTSSMTTAVRAPSAVTERARDGLMEAQRDLIADIPVSDSECQVDVTWTPGSDVGRIYGRSIADGFLRGGWLARAYSPTRFEPPEFRGIRLVARSGDKLADSVAATLGQFARVVPMPSEEKPPCHLEVWIGTTWEDAASK